MGIVFTKITPRKPGGSLTKDDVWGNENSKGMIVARNRIN